MGGGGSQTVNQTFNMDVVNKSLMTTITNNQQSLSAAMNNIQKVKVRVGNMGPDCDMKIGQKINASSQSSATMSPKTINEAKTVISNELVASAAAAMEKTTEAGNLQFGDKQNMNQEVNMAIENVIENTFETNNLNEVIAEMVNLQEGDLEIKNCNGKLDFSQDIVATLMAEAITDSLTQNIADSETLNKLKAATEGSQKTENKGIADIVSKVTGPMKYAIIASVCCVCVLVLGLVAMFLSPAGQNMGREGMKKF
jgi:ribosomal protein L22|tara:strand:+ start:323 stop:1087 length:765 start_codon:yes stop_codon:yes gene_type:complete